MADPQSELNRLVKDGPVKAIFRAEQALSILEEIGPFAESINAKNYGEVLGTFQSFCIEQVVLSISKLFEVPRGYPLLSLPAILNFIKANLEVLEITEPGLLNQQLVRLNCMRDDFDSLSRKEKNIFVHETLVRHLPNLDNNPALEALKTLRDKNIAHPEDIEIESVKKTTWIEAEKLLQYAKDIVGVIGDGYLSTAYMMANGDYLLTNDATRVGRGTTRLLKELTKQ